MRERVARQVTLIRHWKVIEGDYTAAPDIDAAWFIDPPYVGAGKYYVHGSRGIDYQHLAAWCRTRRGRVIVCEQDGATWLPFRSIGKFRAAVVSAGAPKWSAEAIWTSPACIGARQVGLFDGVA